VTLRLELAKEVWEQISSYSHALSAQQILAVKTTADVWIKGCTLVKFENGVY